MGKIDLNLISKIFGAQSEEDNKSEMFPGLPPIFCINLPEEPLKRESVLSHFHEHNLSPVFVEGVQGITIGLRATNPYDYDQYGNGLFVHMSQIGCALSHRQALAVAIAHGAPEFIVCEDDVLLLEGFVPRFLSWRTKLPPEADVAQLEYAACDLPMVTVEDEVRQMQYPFCTACIWWTREAAKKALVLLKPIDRPYDVMLIQRVFPFLNHYIAFPMLATQRSHVKEWPSSVGDAPKNINNQSN